MTIRVAAVQHDIVWEERGDNLARLDAELGRLDVDLIVLPEMFAVGFTMNTEAVAEPYDGKTTQWLVAQAEKHLAFVGGSIPMVLPGDERPANVFTLVSPWGEIHRYAKRHPFSFAGESDHYRPGGPRVTIDVKGVRVTPFICYDLRFANAFWPVAKETDLYLVVASWPSPRREHWKTLLRARAIENQAYVIGVNRVGTGDGLDYVGDSCVIDPMGEVLQAVAHVETTLITSIDESEVERVRSAFPFMLDRRDD